ncbi:ketoacyl-ACP synthase III [Natronospora cellulosivora (SeqCode)]
MRFPNIEDLKTERYAKILSTGIGLPENVVSNQEIIDRFSIMATDRAVEYSLGIKQRRWAEDKEELVELMAKAANQCLERADIDIEKVDRVIYSRLIGEYNIPASAIGVLKKLGVKKGIPAFDVTCACSGFVHAMDIALRYIAAGDEYVLILGGGITSRGVQNWIKANPKTVFLFGDAITAMLIGHSDLKHFLSSYVFTNHKLYDNAFIPLGTTLFKKGNKNTYEDILNMQVLDGQVIMDSSIEYAKIIADKLLTKTNLTLDDIDLFITSDQSTKIWEAQLEALGIPQEKSLSLFYKYGNTVASMSPLILDELIYTNRMKRGDIVMMMAHGAGASSGGMIFKY